MHDADFLIDLMISCDVILPLDNQKKTYLIPCTLPVKDNYVHETELSYRAVCIPNVDDRSIPSFMTDDRCAIHNEVLDQHLFFATDEYRKGSF